uniref:Uncharacterized protein n=1 Tax=Anguilla anguilla TaxID=7936 RepID=A0A0E9Q283_ANGAN
MCWFDKELHSSFPTQEVFSSVELKIRWTDKAIQYISVISTTLLGLCNPGCTSKKKKKIKIKNRKSI